MKVLHLINSSDVKRGGAQKILDQLVSANPKVQSVFSMYSNEDYFVVFKKVLLPLRLLVHLALLRPDIIVGHSRLYLPLMFLIDKFTPIKTVFVCHNVFLSKNWMFRIFTVRHYIAISNAVKKSLLDYVSDERINVILNGTSAIAPERFAGENCRGKTIEIAFIGSLSKVKGVDIAIDALNDFVASTIFSAKFHIIGDGPEKQHLKSKICNNKLKVEFHGYCKNPFSLVRDVELIVIPSYHEGFCLVLVESIINGKLIFASDLPVLREVAGEVPTVNYFPSGDVVELKNLIDTYTSGLCGTKEERLKASDFASKLYSLKTMQEKYLSFYELI
jgi:glycosyltransferase involved in cell wall biosynthesis